MIKLKDILNEEWSDKYKRSIDCDNPKGFSQKAHCQGKEKRESFNEALIRLFEENVPNDPEKWAYAKAQAKKKFDVYPSAYANGWASKKYKELGGTWKTEESVKEGLVQSIGNVQSKLVPSEIYNAINPLQVERRKSLVKELVKTLNRFYKQHGIDWKFTEDMFKFKMYSKN